MADQIINADERQTGVSDDIPMAFRMPERFAAINRLVLRDLNGRGDAPNFYLYTRDEITKYLKNPYRYEKQLRNAVIYLYGASPHFRRLIQYFVSLSDLSYVVSPYRIDTSTAKPQTVRRNYRRTLNLLASMDIRNQFEKILTVCLREDIFYGTIRETSDSVIIQQLPSDWCAVSVVEDNVLNVSFDFSYFNAFPDNLALYPDEFRRKYEIYKNNISLRWQELDAPTSFAIKCNKDVLSYAMPPLAGILREIYDLEDYKQLRLTKTAIENYALLVMTLGVDGEGNWTMDLDKAKEFYRNLDSVVPEEVGTVLSPMPINKISFERTHTGDTNTVAEAEESLFSAAGVPSLLFNNPRASSNALLLSVKVDQSMTFSVVKSIESMLNRFVRWHGYGKYFKVTFLDCSPFNRKEVGDAYLKACQYGIPMVSYYCASQGLLQDEMDGMNFLEDEVLNIKSRFMPLQSSTTLSAEAVAERTAGRPKSDIGELSDNGEISQERDET